jgi:hypothetical protein
MCQLNLSETKAEVHVVEHVISLQTHPSANVLYIQVGDTVEDHNYWGRPEEWTGSNPRPTLKANTTLPCIL